MSGMVQVATAGDVGEAEEIQEILRVAGIASQLEAAAEDDAVHVLVPDDNLDAAQDAIEAMTDPDDLISEP
jgi:class 3 adenylate cyclase